MDNIILFDWLTITSKIDSPESILSLLGLDTFSNFSPCNGRYGYRDGITYEHISVYYNGREEMGVCLDISGQGCRAWETYGNGDFKRMFKLCISDPDNYHITRLDVAYDDKIGILDINKVYKETELQHYLSKFRGYTLEKTDKGTCVYVGSKTSEILFRCYDKAAERNREEEGHWVRWEMLLRRERALAFVFEYLQCDDIGKVFCGVLNNYLKYVKPNKTDSNMKRWQQQKWWLNFTKDCERISLYTPCDVEYNLAKCEDYIYRQAGNALDTLLKIKGPEKLMQELKENKPKPNRKYINILEQYQAHIDPVIAEMLSSHSDTSLSENYLKSISGGAESDVKTITIAVPC